MEIVRWNIMGTRDMPVTLEDDRVGGIDRL